MESLSPNTHWVWVIKRASDPVTQERFQGEKVHRSCWIYYWKLGGLLFDLFFHLTKGSSFFRSKLCSRGWLKYFIQPGETKAMNDMLNFISGNLWYLNFLFSDIGECPFGSQIYIQIVQLASLRGQAGYWELSQNLFLFLSTYLLVKSCS